MKRLAACLLFLALLLLPACGTVPPEAPPATQDTTPSITATEAPTYYQTDSDVIFDFATELPDSIPRGAWTVNRLAEKYGTFESADGQYRAGYATVIPGAWSSNIVVSFAFTDPQVFSFFSENLEDRTDYPFAPADMDLEMELLTVFIKTPEIELPRGLRVGCAKEEVLAAYPMGSENRYVTENFDILFFKHEFRDAAGAFDGMGGSINYLFEENGVLWACEITYWFFDLH